MLFPACWEKYMTLQTASPRGSYIYALTAEIRILIRAVASDPEQDISTLTAVSIDEKGPATLNYAQIVIVVAKDIPAIENELLLRIGQLQAIRDALVRMTRPATGLSIAYTSLVSGNQRGKGSESTYELAQSAFGGLGLSARIHRLFIAMLCITAVVLAIVASWEATKASLGKSLLEVLEPLRAQQSVIANEKFRLEMSLSKDISQGDAGKDLHRLPVCDRYLLIANDPGSLQVSSSLPKGIPLHATPEIRDLCGRDLILSRNFELAHEALRQYRVFWPELVGGLYAPSARFLKHLVGWLGGSMTTSSEQPSGQLVPTSGDDIEFWVAPTVQVITSFILPFIFGIIGSLLYVILQHYNQVRANLLVPRDLALANLRVILGIVVAVCVSLLIAGSTGPAAPIQPSASGSTAPGSLVGSLTLSASLITFLAGFGAEAVFTLLHGLVQRVFASPDQTRP
jgi:hypothetical protein